MLLLVAIFIPGVAMATEYTDDLIPDMTSNNYPSGYASSTGQEAHYYAYLAFDDSVGSFHETDNRTGWLAYEFSSLKKICKYTLLVSNYFDRAPKNWTFEGWNGSAWVILDTQSNVTDWNTQNKKEFVFNNDTSYIKYQINVSANNGNAGF